MAILEAKNLSFHFPEGEKVLDNVSFKVEEGEFVVLCGPSGSGKSTLLRLIKREIAPHGTMDGQILYGGITHSSINKSQMAKEVGMVFQDPENQIVMDRVMEEIIFGLENMGIPSEEMRKKVAEIVHFFGLEAMLDRKTYELSGGQKQLVNLASILLLEPKVLLLDEPTAQLDPVAAKDFIGMLHRMNEEFGITVIIVEHRLEELLALADRAIVIEKGEIKFDNTPREIIYQLAQNSNHEIYSYLPSSAVLYIENQSKIKSEDIPLTVKEGKQWIKHLNIHPIKLQEKQDLQFCETLLQLKNVDFQYDKNQERILNKLNLSIYEGEWLSIVGANGTGKSTLLKLMAGLIKAQRGSIVYKGKKVNGPLPKEIGYLPQNPKLFFLKDTVIDELNGIINQFQLNHLDHQFNHLLDIFQLKLLLDRHPYDLSGGEIQKAALAGVLLPGPNILLVDEPTKGLDPHAKQLFGDLLKGLNLKGMTIVMVTHDIEFAAKYSTRCAMMFRGEITAAGTPKSFFQGNAFYTTVINRITRTSNVPEVLTVEEARTTWNIQSGY